MLANRKFAAYLSVRLMRGNETMFYLPVPKDEKTTSHNRLEATGGAWVCTDQCSAKPRTMSALYDIMRGTRFARYGCYCICTKNGDCQSCNTYKFADPKNVDFDGLDVVYIHQMTEPAGSQDKNKEMFVYVSPYLDEAEASKHFSHWYSASEVSRWNGEIRKIGNVIELKKCIA